MSKPRVLVVEDEPLIAKSIRRRLQGLGYEVPAIASSGAEAVQAAVETRPDVVLMDIRLEGEMDGVEAAAQIRAWRDIPVIYLTAHADEAILQRAKVTEPFGYILKPFQDRELHSNIAMALYKYEQEQKLKESEERYRLHFENVTDVVYSIDPEFRVLSVSPSVEKALGYKPEELIGRSFQELDILAPEYLEAAFSDVMRVLAGERIVSAVYEFIAKDGTRKFGEASGAPLIRDGKVVAMASVARDITERKRAEEALRESEGKYRRLIEQSLMGIGLSCGNQVIFANPALLRMFGYDNLEEFANVPLLDHVAPASRDQIASRLKRLAQGEALETDFEYDIQRKDGKTRTLHASTTHIREGGEIYTQTTFQDITERKRAEELIHTQRDLALALSAASGLEEGLRLCLGAAFHVSGMDCGGAYLVDEASGSLDLAFHQGLPPDFVKSASHYNADSPNARLVMAGKPVYTRHQELGVPLDEAKRREGLRAIAVIPVHYEGRVIGSLNVASHTIDEVPAFACDALETIAAQIGNSIVHLRAEEEIKQRSKELATLNAIAAAMSQSLDLEEILDAALKETLAVFNVERGLIYLLDKTSQTFTPVVHRGISLDMLREVTGFKMGQGLSGWVAESDQPLIVADLAADPRNISSAASREGLRSYAGMPIKSRGEPVGVMTLATHQEGYFKPEHISLLSHIGNQVGVAVENAQFFRETKRRFEEMMALYQTSLGITARLEMPELLKSIVERAVSLLRAEAGGIYLYAPEREELRWVIGHDYTGKYVWITLKPGEGMAGKVFQTGEPLIVDDYGAWEGRAAAFEADQSPTAVLGVPLRWQDQIIGVLAIDADAQKRAFSQSDVWLATLFANQAAIAIENARLFQNEQKRAAQLAVVNQVARRVASILDLDQLLQEVVTAIRDGFNYYHVGLFLLDEIAGEIEMRAIAGGFVDVAPPGHRLTLGEGIAGWTAETGQSLLANDVSQEPHYVLGILKEALSRAELCVPLKLAGKVIGVLDIQSTQLNAFDETDLMAMETLTDQAAVAIENARLYEEVRQRVEQMAALRQVNMALASTLEQEQILEMVLDQLKTILDYDSATIQTLSGPYTVHVAAARPPSYDEELRKGFDASQNPLFYEMRDKRKAVVIDDVHLDDRWIKIGGDWERVRSWVGVPLFARDNFLGFLNVGKGIPGFYKETDVQLLLDFAQGAALAIENARLYQEMMRRLEETQALSAVTAALTRSLNLDQVLQAIVESATRLIPTSTGGVIHLVDEAGRKLVPRAVSPKAHVEENLGMPIGEGIAGLVMQEKRLINVPNVEEDPRFLKVGVAAPYKSLLTAPLQINGDCIGTISLNSDQVSAFSADDVRLLDTLAAQAALAVRNARLHQEVQRRVEELTFLNRVGRTVTSILDLEQVLTTVMEETVFMLKTEAGSILLIDEESGELAFKAVVGPQSEKVKGLRLPLGQGIAGWVARQGQPLLVPDVREDPRFYSGIDEATDFVTRSILAVPLEVKGIVIGVLEAINKTRGDFSQADVELLSSMAQWAATAIENARLYRDLQGRMEELKRTQAQLIQSVKLAAIGELAAGVAHEINNPLTSIIGFTQLLLRGVDDGNPMKEDLKIIDREAARTRAIVGGLLDFSRQTEPQLEPADVNEVLRSTVALARHQAKVTRVTIRESYDENLPPVLLDVNQMKQVFLNIMANAIQAMPEGGELKVVTAYRPQVRRKSIEGPALSGIEGVDGMDCVAVEFHDTGIGIPAENLARIFDPFFTTKAPGQGTGLGLSVSYGIVDRHGGWIEVESKVGVGSTFTVMLPVTIPNRSWSQ